MGYPVGPLLQELARRIRCNLDFIDKQASQWGSPQQDEPPYADTQLLISLLGVLVFPAERNSAALGKLLASYGALGDVVEVVWKRDEGSTLMLEGANESVTLDPANISDLPQLLRNSIAHFNLRPINVDGRFGGVRVWNRDLSGQLTFIADIRFDELRRMARGILDQLADGATAVELDDPPDPLEEALSRSPVERGARRPPRPNDVTWTRMLAACGGNYDAAHELMTVVLNREAKRIARE